LRVFSTTRKHGGSPRGGMIPALDGIVANRAPAFTPPSLATSCHFLLGGLMCLGKHPLWRVAPTTQPQETPDLWGRHGFDTYYNFLARSAWTPRALAYHVAALIRTRLNLSGRITLLVADTLAHKRGQGVWGRGWFPDAVASTPKRVATASGHNWVVMAVAGCVPGTSRVILAVPLLARLHRAGAGPPGGARRANTMLAEVLDGFPNRRFTLVADGAYASKEMLAALDERVTVVGRLRGAAALYDPKVPRPSKGQRGRKASKGPRWPSPKEAAAKADRTRRDGGSWLWQVVTVLAHGQERPLQAVSDQAVGPHVLGLRPIQVVGVRDPSGKRRDG